MLCPVKPSYLIKLIGTYAVFCGWNIAVASATAEDCVAIASSSLDGVRVDIAEVISERQDLPPFCRIAGEIEPSIGFETRLPMKDWNGKFLMSGCGAYCGEVLPDRKGYSNSVNYAVKRGYAATTTDSGHQASSTDTSWAYNNRGAEVLYAHAWVPLADAASRKLILAFYSESERYSYFSGCSNGGRTALKVAQLYPQLFDGIASGCPTINLMEAAGIQGVFLDRTLVDDKGELILRAEKIPMLSQAVRNSCDSPDGLTDGLVSDPSACDFNPETLQCADDDLAESCLTAREVEEIKRLYAGAHDSQGKALYFGLPYGSEPYWARSLVGENELGQHYLADFGTNFLRYLSFEDDPGPDYHSGLFDLDEDIPKLEEMGRLFNATSPDLSGLQRAGGKLLMYHGLADTLIMYQQSVDFYASVTNNLATAKEVREFFRLFLIPGADHCWGMTGYAPDLFDPLLVLEKWVESGEIPERIKAIQYAESSDGEGDGQVLRSRALCPYPKRGQFIGSGSPFAAENFDCVMPVK